MAWFFIFRSPVLIENPEVHDILHQPTLEACPWCSRLSGGGRGHITSLWVIFQDSDKSCSWIQEAKRTAKRKNDQEIYCLCISLFFPKKKSLSDIQFLEVLGVSLSNPLKNTPNSLPFRLPVQIVEAIIFG